MKWKSVEHVGSVYVCVCVCLPHTALLTTVTGWSAGKKRLQRNISSRELATFTVTWDKTISKANKQEACCGDGSSGWARSLLPASVAPPDTKEQTVIPTWLFCRGPHGAMIKTVQVTEGVPRPSPSLDSSSTCSLPMESLRKRRRQAEACSYQGGGASRATDTNTNHTWSMYNPPYTTLTFEIKRCSRSALCCAGISGVQVSYQVCVWNNMFDCGCLHVSTRLLLLLRITDAPRPLVVLSA